MTHQGAPKRQILTELMCGLKILRFMGLSETRAIHACAVSAK
jgi:hypothetical protein